MTSVKAILVGVGPFKKQLVGNLAISNMAVIFILLRTAVDTLLL